jgi:hypothetical protein
MEGGRNYNLRFFANNYLNKTVGIRLPANNGAGIKLDIELEKRNI